MAPLSVLGLVVGVLLAVPALSDSVKSLLSGNPQRRTAQTDGLVSYPCPPNTFISDITLYSGFWVYYMDSITCGSTPVSVNAGNPLSDGTPVTLSTTTYFYKESHGIESGGHVTQLTLYERTDVANGPYGTLMFSVLEDLPPFGSDATGVKVSADSAGLTDFQFIYDFPSVSCGAASGHICGDWEGCCSASGICGFQDEDCGVGCQANYGTGCTTVAPTLSPTLSPTSMPSAQPTVIQISAPTESITQTPTSVPTASPTSSVTQTPTTQPTVATSAPTASVTQAPTSLPVTARDLEITFNITTVVALDTAKILAATAFITGVLEENIKISTISNATSTGARRLDTQMIAVSEHVTGSSVATGDITASITELEALTGLIITDLVVTEIPSDNSNNSKAGLLAGTIVSAIALCGILAYAFYRRKIRKDAAMALAPQLAVEKVSGEDAPPRYRGKVSAPVYTAPALATPFGASDLTAPVVVMPVAVRQREKVPPSYRAPASYEA